MKSKGLKAVIILIGAVLLVFLLYQSFGTMLPGLVQALKSGSEKEIAEYLNPGLIRQQKRKDSNN